MENQEKAVIEPATKEERDAFWKGFIIGGGLAMFFSICVAVDIVWIISQVLNK